MRRRLDAVRMSTGSPRAYRSSQRRVDLGVGRTVEVVGLEHLDDVGDGLGRQHHGTEHRLLGLEVLWGDAPIVEGTGRTSSAVARANAYRPPWPEPAFECLDARTLRRRRTG